jgi:hypothetical protein
MWGNTELTFIILARDPQDDRDPLSVNTIMKLPMIGDVNLFLKGDPADEDFEAEVEIMIAGP